MLWRFHSMSHLESMVEIRAEQIMWKFWVWWLIRNTPLGNTVFWRDHSLFSHCQTKQELCSKEALFDVLQAELECQSHTRWRKQVKVKYFRCHCNFFFYCCLIVSPSTVNECEEDNGGCAHICTDTPSSYSCSCHIGYALDQDQHRCTGTTNVSTRHQQ